MSGIHSNPAGSPDFEAFQKAAAVVKEHGGSVNAGPQDTADAITGNRSLRQRFCTWFPRLSSFVGIADQQANLNTRIRFGKALAEVYGPQASQHALDTVGANAIKRTGLTASAFEKMHLAAKNFHGSGNGRCLKRNVTVRIWPFKGQSHPGHAAVDVKDRLSKQRTYVSYWPSFAHDAKAVSKNLVPFRPRLAEMPSPHLDYVKELGPSAKQKLGEGTIEPRANQKKIQNERTGQTEWGKRPDKYCLPLIGHNATHGFKWKNDGPGGQAKFTFFGLDEAGMRGYSGKLRKEAGVDSQGQNLSPRGTRGLDRPQQTYKFVSKEDNCASKALETLESGGAMAFVARPQVSIYYDPNDVSRFATQVQAEVDRLNDRVDTIRQLQTEKFGDAPNYFQQLDDQELLGSINNPATRQCFERLLDQKTQLIESSRPEGFLKAMKDLVESFGETNTGSTDNISLKAELLQRCEHIYAERDLSLLEASVNTLAPADEANQARGLHGGTGKFVSDKDAFLKELPDPTESQKKSRDELESRLDKFDEAYGEAHDGVISDPPVPREELLRKVEQLALAMEALREILPEIKTDENSYVADKMLNSAGAMLRDMAEAVRHPAAHNLARELRGTFQNLYSENRADGGHFFESDGSEDKDWLTLRLNTRTEAYGPDVLRQELAALKSFQDPVLEGIADAALKLLDTPPSKT